MEMMIEDSDSSDVRIGIFQYNKKRPKFGQSIIEVSLELERAEKGNS